jgi:hypothetical protein
LLKAGSTPGEQQSRRQKVVRQDKERIMKLAGLIAAVLAFAAAGCAYAPPPAVLASTQLPPPLVRPSDPQTFNIVTANRDAAQIIQGLEARGLRPVPSDVSRVDLLAGSPGYAWRIGQESLFIHSYGDPPAASAAAQRFVMMAVSRSQIIDWAGTPRLFQCRTALALYLGDSPQALNVLTYLCGPPVWNRP